MEKNKININSELENEIQNQQDLENDQTNKKNIFIKWVSKEDNIYFIVGLIIIVSIFIGLWYLVKWIINVYSTQDYESLTRGLIYLVSLIPAFFILKFLHDQSDNVKNEKLRIAEERKAIQEKLKQQKMDVFYTIQTNLNQLQDYYIINTSQAKKSFFFSMLASISGLLLIILGVLLYYFFNDQNKTTITALTTFSGVLSQFIGASYFILYRKSLSQLNFFFSQLIKSQNIMLAIDLSKTVIDDEKRYSLTENIINGLIKTNNSENTINEVK